MVNRRLAIGDRNQIALEKIEREVNKDGSRPKWEVAVYMGLGKRDKAKASRGYS